MGLFKGCKPPDKICENSRKLIDEFTSLVDFNEVEVAPLPPSDRGFLLSSPSDPESEKKISEEEIAQKLTVIGELLMALMTQDKDGEINSKQVSDIKIQVQKISLDLERLSIRLQESNLNESEFEVIKTDIVRGIVQFLSMVLRC